MSSVHSIQSDDDFSTRKIEKDLKEQELNQTSEEDSEDDYEDDNLIINHDSDIVPSRHSIDHSSNNKRYHGGHYKKNSVVSRGMDFIKKMRWKYNTNSTHTIDEAMNHSTGGIIGRRLSQPDMDQIAAADEYWRSSWSTQNTPRASMDSNSLLLDHFIIPSSNSTTTISSSSNSHCNTHNSNNNPPTNDLLLSPIHENNHVEAQYSRALHTPSRFLPQNQAVITTTRDGTILLFNDIASLCFGIDKSTIGRSVMMAVLEDPFRKEITNVLSRRRKNNHHHHNNHSRHDHNKGRVLVCGTIIPIVKANGCKSVASLWLKEKNTDNGDNVYIWIFEEIYETSLSVYVDSECIIRRVLGSMLEIYGYHNETDIIGKPVNCLVPALSKEQRDDNLEKIDRLKFFGSQASQGIYFPVILSLNRHVAIGNDDLASFVVKITSLPSIGGLMTVHCKTGLVKSLSPVPAKYLFGHSVKTIIEDQIPIKDMIPQLPTILDRISATDIAANTLVTHQICKGVLTNEEPIIYVVHRDGSRFEVEIQIKLLEDDLANVWITYDRIDAVAKYEKRCIKKKDNGDKLTLLTNKHLFVSSSNTATTATKIADHLQDCLASTPTTKLKYERTQEKIDDEQIARKNRITRPTVRPLRISSFGAVDEQKKLFPTSYFDSTSRPPSPTSSSSKNESIEPIKHPLDDYVILDVLGQGTYGMAKLAYRKDDSSQKKLVIKYIIKSRIIVDSWIRDRQLGSIPMEIHILRTLQKHPHLNCCSLVTNLEDEDYYFLVMELLGDGMDLFDYIELNKNMSEPEIKNIFYQVANAVKHLHQHKIVHRDIKDENIILDQDGTIYLIDFGCATYYKTNRKFDTFTGTLEYCAPEVLKGKPYEGPPQDIWASGILLFTLIYRENPFYNIDEIMERELRVPFVVSESSLDLIKKMLERDEEKRINIDQVLDHPWFHSIVNNTS